MLRQFKEYVMQENFLFIFSIRYEITEHTQANPHKQNKCYNVHIC